MSAPAPSKPCLPCADCPLTQTPAACASPGTQRGFCLEATCGINLSFSATATRNPLTLKIKRELCNLTLKGPCLFKKDSLLFFFATSKRTKREFWLSIPKPDPLFLSKQNAGVSLVLTRESGGDNLQRAASKHSTPPVCTEDQHFKSVSLLCLVGIDRQFTMRLPNAQILLRASADSRR